MVSVLASIFAALSSAGIIGWSDQYLVLFITGVCVRAHLVTPVGSAAFIGEPWFLTVTALAWILTTLPSLVPHNSIMASVVNAISGPITLFSGAIFALVGAGIIAHVRPELATSLYLLTRDSRWTDITSYHTGDVAVLVGGASVAGTLTAAKFVAKPGIALKTGTFAHLSPIAFAGLESGSALALTPVVLALERTHPLLLALFMTAVVGALLYIVGLSIKWMRSAGRGIGRFVELLSDHPRLGLAVLAEFLVPGLGSLSLGLVARALFLLAIWGLLVFLALTVVGLLIAFPVYLLVARASAISLFRRVIAQLDFSEPPGPDNENTGDARPPVGQMAGGTR